MRKRFYETKACINVKKFFFLVDYFIVSARGAVSPGHVLRSAPSLHLITVNVCAPQSFTRWLKDENQRFICYDSKSVVSQYHKRTQLRRWSEHILTLLMDAKIHTWCWISDHLLRITLLNWFVEQAPSFFTAANILTCIDIGTIVKY